MLVNFFWLILHFTQTIDQKLSEEITLIKVDSILGSEYCKRLYKVINKS